MAFVLKNIQTITNGTTGYDTQAEGDTTDLQAWIATEVGTGVITGCTLSQTGSGTSMHVKVAAGLIAIKGKVVAVAAQTLSVTAASSTDRRDIVTINATGTASVTKGTVCGKATWKRTTTTNVPPVKPAIPATHCLVGELTIKHTTTGIATKNIVQKQCPINRYVGAWISTYWYSSARYEATGMAITKGKIYFIRLTVPAPMTIKAIGAHVSTTEATVTIRLGIYRDNGHGKPGKLVKTGGTFASANGNKTVTLTPTVLLAPGVYWIAMVRQGSSASATFKMSKINPTWFQYGSAVWSGQTALTKTIANTFGSWASTATTYTSGALPTTAPAVTAVTNGATAPYLAVQST